MSLLEVIAVIVVVPLAIVIFDTLLGVVGFFCALAAGDVSRQRNLTDTNKQSNHE